VLLKLSGEALAGEKVPNLNMPYLIASPFLVTSRWVISFDNAEISQILL